MITDPNDNLALYLQALARLEGTTTYSPDRQWILSDSYPDSQQEHHLFVYHVPTERFVELGRFFEAPWTKEIMEAGMRCDLHPRWSRDGTKICFDSTHEGKRGIYIVDVGEVLRENVASQPG